MMKCDWDLEVVDVVVFVCVWFFGVFFESLVMIFYKYYKCFVGDVIVVEYLYYFVKLWVDKVNCVKVVIYVFVLLIIM